MRKIIKKTFLVVCLAVAMVFCVGAFGNKVYAAQTEASKLEQLKDGWQRADDSNPYLKYSSKWEQKTNDGRWYKSTKSYCNGVDEPLTIKFKGTKFRIIGPYSERDEFYGAEEIVVNVDGVEVKSYSNHGPLSYKKLLCEVDNLSDETHVVTIKGKANNKSSKNYVWIDAIDIDKDGELLDANLVKVSDIALDKTDLTMNINTTENLTASVLPKDAANKNITWTSSDDKICTVDENGKVTAVAYGNAVITATANDGSGKSASCTVKVIDNRHGVLTVNMTNGKQYTYDMTLDEISAFTTWYDNRSEGKGKSYYVIETKPSSGAFKTKTDYLNFNSISDFSIEAY